MTGRFADFFKDAIKTAQATVEAEQAAEAAGTVEATEETGPPEPATPEAIAAAVDAHLAAGDLAAARKAVLRGLELHPRAVSLMVKRGEINQQAGNQLAAELAFLAALDVDEAQAHVHLRLGILRQEMGRDEDAERAFRRALELDRGALEARRYLALGHMRREAWPEALAQLALIKLKDPLDLAATQLEAAVLERQGDADGALACLTELVYAQRADGQVFWRIGRLHVAARRADEALVAFRRCVEKDPDRWEAWFYIGRFTEADQPAAAIVAYETVLSHQPAHGDAALRAGRLLAADHQYERAEACFTIAAQSMKHREAALAEHTRLVDLRAAMAASLAGEA